MYIRTVLSLVLLLMSAEGRAQQPQTLAVSRPEAIAGRWEMPNGHGGAVGININLTTSIEGTPTTLIGQRHSLVEFEVAVYQRTGPEIKFGNANYFITGSDNGATWDGHRLRLHAAGQFDVPPGEFIIPMVNLDIAWHDNSETWTGLFERRPFRSRVVLRRPTSTRESPFVGTWSGGNDGVETCLHVAAEGEGYLIGWFDRLKIPGRMRFAHGLQLPPGADDYGEMAKLHLDTPRQITVTLGEEVGICCSRSVLTAVISKDGKTVAVTDDEAYQPAVPVVWRRMPGDSCAEKEVPETKMTRVRSAPRVSKVRAY